ncbi:helix-turn-helix domain-containing protein [Mycobacterium sp. Aquia_213]|uniref:AraC-like ligand-binding domain-containing protein n=1 Tax=Mycobacterium sp. Aquia_213 TaxID=2991728 RepID=UPI00226E8B94|nr:helix-turn-helix domain-containing protein [Mycobacterium sp. Aquia_213]WAC90016.1 helix-turn-helix domain-containing protein [Mycobacterium sp. Aquia_213]
MTDSKSERRGGQQRFKAFHQLVGDTFVPVAVSTDDADAFRAKLDTSSLGAVRINRLQFNGGVVLRRTPRQLRRAAPVHFEPHSAEYLKVGVHAEGRCVVRQDGREANLLPGDYVMYDTTRPFEFAVDGKFQMFSVLLPRELLRIPAAQLSRLTARSFNGRQGMGALLTPFLVELAKQVTKKPEAPNIRLADAVFDMLEASFCEQLACERPEGRSQDQYDMMLGILAYIERNLGDPDLDVPTIATAHHISIRHLQRMFENDGHTVTEWIRSRRIEHCRKDLANAELAAVPVSVIGARWGLANAANFSRLFKAVHGRSPREYRVWALS